MRPFYGKEARASSPFLTYSPSLNPDAPPPGMGGSGRDMGPMEQSGTDVAIHKIAERSLPTVRLAANSAGLRFGEQIFIIGYPEVVAYCDCPDEWTSAQAALRLLQARYRRRWRLA